MDQLSRGFTLFFSLLVEALPFLLLGVIFSSLLLLFVDERKLIALLPKHPLLGALAGSAIGFIFPVCECGNIPVARRLLTQGVSASVAISFLLAAPTINPIVIWVTWAAFRDQPEIVVLRVGFSFIIAATLGWVFSSQADPRPLLQPAVAAVLPRPARTMDGPNLLRPGTYLLDRPGQPKRLDASEMQAVLAASPPASKPFKTQLYLFLENCRQELRELGGILVLGSLVAATVQVMAPKELILGLGQGPVISVITMMAVAAVVSICSTVDAFFVLSFAASFTTGSLLAFLIFGPMVDLKNIALLLTVFRGRAIVYLLVLVTQLTFLLSLFVNLQLS